MAFPPTLCSWDFSPDCVGACTGVLEDSLLLDPQLLLGEQAGLAEMIPWHV